MSTERNLRWLGGTALFLAGAIVSFLAIRYWRGVSPSLTPAIEQTTNSHNWGFQANFKPPAHVIASAPDKTELLSFEFGRSKNRWEVLSTITIKNLTDLPYSISYQILGYNSKKQRVGHASDGVEIGARESTLREPFLIPDVSGVPSYSSFRLIVEIEH